jgi:hypothetical protein
VGGEGLDSLRRKYGLKAKHRVKNEQGKFRQQRHLPARKEPSGGFSEG